jgi:hypothetical protein
MKDEDGIKIYASDSGNTNFKAVKVDCILQGNIEKLVKILLNVDNHKNWNYSTKNSYLVKRISNNEVLYYIELAFPFFTSNRDLVIDMKIDWDTLRRQATIDSEAVPGIVAEKKDIIRIPIFHSRYETTQVDKDHLHIVYYSVADPGGHIWATFANMVVAKGPFNTFENLAALLKQ